MPDRGRDSRRMLTGLLAASHLMPLDRLPQEVNKYAAFAGLHDVLIYLSDLQQLLLRLMTGSGLDAGQDADGREAVLKIEGTLPGRAFQQGRILPAGSVRKSGSSWWVPLLDGAERLGLLRVTTQTDDEHAREDMEALASLVAMIVVTKRGRSDSHARLVRTAPLNVAAEMQWHLMQPRAYADDRVVIAAAMEPAYQVSGDAYEYAVAGNVVHLAVFDAMGHDIAAGVTANLAMATCRNSRRQDIALIAVGDDIERILIEQFGGRRYVTAVLADLDTDTGILSWVTHGHHPPVIIRGGRWTSHLQCPPGHPLGTDLGVKATVCREQLEPGDRVVLYTDGITEARRPGGPEFGVQRFLDFLIRHHTDGLPVPETLRRLMHSILDYQQGRLDDDATVLLLEWHGPTPYTSEEVAALVGLPDQSYP